MRLGFSPNTRLTLWLGSLGLLALSSGCLDSALVPGTGSGGPRPPGVFESGPLRQLPAGTFINVTLLDSISTGTALVGDSWRGVVARPVIAFGRQALPRGCRVRGTVMVVEPGSDRSDARLQLEIQSIQLDSGNLLVTAVARPVIASSIHQKGSIGAITGGSAVGPSSDRSGGGGRDAVAARANRGFGAGVSARLRPRPVALKEGTIMTFVASRTVALE